MTDQNKLKTLSLQEILGYEDIERAPPSLFEKPKIEARGYGFIPFFVAGAIGIVSLSIWGISSLISNDEKQKIERRETQIDTGHLQEIGNYNTVYTGYLPGTNIFKTISVAKTIYDFSLENTHLKIPKENYYNIIDTGVYLIGLDGASIIKNSDCEISNYSKYIETIKMIRNSRIETYGSYIISKIIKGNEPFVIYYSPWRKDELKILIYGKQEIKKDNLEISIIKCDYDQSSNSVLVKQ